MSVLAEGLPAPMTKRGVPGRRGLVRRTRLLDGLEHDATTFRVEHVAQVGGVELNRHRWMIRVLGDMDHGVALAVMPELVARLERLGGKAKLSASVGKVDEDRRGAHAPTVRPRPCSGKVGFDVMLGNRRISFPWPLTDDVVLERVRPDTRDEPDLVSVCHVVTDFRRSRQVAHLGVRVEPENDLPLGHRARGVPTWPAFKRTTDVDHCPISRLEGPFNPVTKAPVPGRRGTSRRPFPFPPEGSDELARRLRGSAATSRRASVEDGV